LKKELAMKFYDLLITAKETATGFDGWVSFMRKEPMTDNVICLLKGVPQATKYHPEFDNLKHTYLVVQAIHKLNEPRLLEAAFLHDVGKKYRTNVGNGRIYSYGHASSSADCMEQYKDFVTDFDFTHNIVKKHMDFNDPANKKLKKDPDLRTFIIADKIISRTLYRDEFPFYDPIISKIKEQLLFFNQRNSTKTVFVAVGISGSGKSTYIRDNFDSSAIVCPDQIREEICGDVSDQSKNDKVWRQAKNDMRKIVDSRGSVVLDAMNVNRFSRISMMCNFNDCKKVALVFNVDIDEAKKRISEDIGEGVNRSNVPEEIVDKQFRNFNKGLRSLDNEFNKVVHFNEEEQ
jgi:predicted kinase